MKYRKPVIAGNWKINTNVESGIKFVKEILNLSDSIPNVEKIICPPFVSLTSVARALHGSSIQLGAQNVNANENGTFTGEISTTMLRGLISHVIIGHSERRIFNGESSDQVATKAITVSNAGIVPILCVGEDLSIRKSGKAANFITKQLKASLKGFLNWESLIIAYEPIWAIGTGKSAELGYIEEVHGEIREELESLEIKELLGLIYGGSVKADTAKKILSLDNVDGLLVGGASLKEKEFSHIALNSTIK